MPFRCVVGDNRAAREARAREHAARSGFPVSQQARVARWPFERSILPGLEGTGVIWLPELHRAFLAGQSSGTRLVLTQSTYQLQRWLDWLERVPGTLVIAHAGRTALRSVAPEAFIRRGPWARIELEDLDGDASGEETAGPDDEFAEIRAAFTHGSPQERLDASMRSAAAHADNPALLLAVASARMELGEEPPARDALDGALRLASDWEAPWFEYGKLWLRADDLERAAEAFQRAVTMMPSFAAALSNLGAALAETDRVDEAVSALHQALVYDPEGYTILNNLGVICREQGRLDEAIAAGHRVIQLAPSFVFGYYNLAHALFLQGRFEESRDMYGLGLARDPQKNAVQACRYAVARAATGDESGAIADLRQLAGMVPEDVGDRIFGEAEETLGALVTVVPSRAGSIQNVLQVVRDLVRLKPDTTSG